MVMKESLQKKLDAQNQIFPLSQKYGIRICDLSHEYSGYKDLNEYLCGKDNLLHI